MRKELDRVLKFLVLWWKQKGVKIQDCPSLYTKFDDDKERVITDTIVLPQSSAPRGIHEISQGKFIYLVKNALKTQNGTMRDKTHGKSQNREVKVSNLTQQEMRKLNINPFLIRPIRVVVEGTEKKEERLYYPSSVKLRTLDKKGKFRTQRDLWKQDSRNMARWLYHKVAD